MRPLFCFCFFSLSSFARAIVCKLYNVLDYSTGEQNAGIFDRIAVTLSKNKRIGTTLTSDTSCVLLILSQFVLTPMC